MSITFKNQEILTDDEGFLQNPDDWSIDLMYEIARLNNLQLTDDHILIINLVREYYHEYGTTPAMRSLIALLKKKNYNNLCSSVQLARLFPQGAAKMASKLAGLPKPVKCI